MFLSTPFHFVFYVQMNTLDLLILIDELFIKPFFFQKVMFLCFLYFYHLACIQSFTYSFL